MLLLAAAQLGAVRLGAAVSTAGDVNAVAYGDVIIGATHYDHGQLDEGGAFVFHGGAVGLPADPSTTLESDQTNSGFGGAVSAAGDVNGDGNGDVVVGAGRAEIPAGGGCTLLVQPPHVVALLPLGGLGPGAGSAILAGAFPVGGPSGAIDLQAFVADPTPATGWAASAGLELAVP